jgi:hypothetical protein
MLGGTVWTLDYLKFDHNDVRDSNGVQWILTEEKGFWGAPGTGATLSPRLNRHGVYRSPGWKKERTVSLTGRLYAQSYEVLRRAEANLLGILSDPKVPGTLTCYSELGAMTLSVFLDDAILCTPLNIVSEPGVEFSIQVVAPDPRKYSIESQTQSTGLPVDSGDGLDYTEVVTPDANQGLYFGLGSSTTGLTFGTSNASGFVILSNAGTAPTSPVYTIFGPLTNPTLTTSAGSTIKYNGTLTDGEFVVIDPAAPSVLLGGTATRRELLYPANFEGFNIPGSIGGVPGTLKVGLSHSGAASATGYFRAVYKTAWF